MTTRAEAIRTFKPAVVRLLVPLAFIALTTMLGIFVFEQISNAFFHPLMFMNAHLITIVMVGLLTAAAAFVVMLRFEALNRGLRAENSERRKAEKELKQARAQAELYIDLMCHDINNMNHVSMGYLEMALDKVATGGRLGTDDIILLKKPLESLRNTARLIGNVQALQREHGGPLNLKPVNVGRVLADVKAQYSDIPDRAVTIDYAPGPKCLVMANELLIELYANIVGNAIKHSRGPLRIDIGWTVTAGADQKYCAVTIADNGPGIPDRQKEELSGRLCPARARYAGHGLGLCLIQTLIEDFRGKLQIEDRVPGDYSKGTKVTVKIPLAPA